MVFTLRRKDSKLIYYVCKGKEYSVGKRNNNDIILLDNSISRKHATIKVDGDYLIVVDCQSRWGIFVNKKAITPNTPVRLNELDSIRFGLYENEFILEKIKLVTAGSSLTASQKSELINIMENLGGVFLKNWDSTCTHLTNQELTLTVKVLNAIIDEKPVVNLDFWRVYYKNVQSLKPPPNEVDFKPPISEMFLTEANMKPNSDRKQLFRGKCFVFPNEVLKKKIADIIYKAGGTSTSWERNPLTRRQITNCKDYIFIHDENEKSYPQSLRDIYEYLNEIGQRAIPYCEIATAIINCSCEKYCNPYFDKLGTVFMSKKKEPNQENEYVLAFDSQSQSSQPEIKTEVIPASVEDVQETPLLMPPPPTSNPFHLTSKPTSTSNPFLTTSKLSSKRPALNQDDDNTVLKKIKSTKFENPFIKNAETSVATIQEELVNSVNISNNVGIKRPNTSLTTVVSSKTKRLNPFAINNNQNAAKKKKPSSTIFSINEVKEQKIEKRQNIEDSSAIQFTLPEYNVNERTPLSQTWFVNKTVKIEDKYPQELSFFEIPANNVLKTCKIGRSKNNVSTNSNDDLILSNGKNFKKFVKNQIKKPQIRGVEFSSFLCDANGTLCSFK